MIKQFRFASVLLGVTLVGLSACASLRVTTDENTALAKSVQCRSFTWAGSFREGSPLRATVANPLNESRLRASIAAHLQSAGMVQANEDATCLVGYGIGARNVVEAAYPVGVGWGWGWRRGAFGAAGWDGPYVYREGVIGIDLYDAKSKQPFWHATVDQDLYGATGPDAEKKIDAAVAALLAKFPGRPG